MSDLSAQASALASEKKAEVVVTEKDEIPMARMTRFSVWINSFSLGLGGWLHAVRCEVKRRADSGFKVTTVGKVQIRVRMRGEMVDNRRFIANANL